MSKTVTKYAQTVNAQINPNTAKREKWSNIGNAVGHTSKYGSAKYTKTTSKKATTYNYPYKVTAHDFRFNIPSNAYITSLKVEVCMKADKGGKIPFPACGFYINDKRADVKESKKESGWHNGVYWVEDYTLLAKSDKIVSYVMRESVFKQGKYTVDNLNSTYFGVDLDFYGRQESNIVYLKWVRITIKYDEPNFVLTHDVANNTQSNPVQTRTGVAKLVKYTLKQTTKAKGGNRCLKLDVPFGTELLDGVYVSKGSYNNGIWSLNCNGVTSADLLLEFIDYTIDTQYINLSMVKCDDYTKSDGVSKKYWYESKYGRADDYGDITAQIVDVPHYRETCCFMISSKIISDVDDTITFGFNNSFSYENINYTLDEVLSSQGISIESSTNSTVTFNVPVGEELDLCFKVCMRLLSQGEHTLKPYIQNGSDGNTVYFTIKPPYEYHFGNKQVFDEENNIANYLFIGEEIGFLNHRIASELDTGAYVLPCRVKESDSLMTQSKPNIHMYKWEQLDYIGCVPLEHLHFDPKSTYKDKLLDTHYKNKRYMGKELASDEDITLNVRLHPQQVTTIQGLIDMDKPVPINANHRCFEGDALNHRGWAEIYAVTTELTNPNWYKCDIDVKYLTHNLNTRFKINKGDKTFSSYPMPSLLFDSVSTGDSLSDETALSYFTIDTDGGYIYNSEAIHTDYYRNEDDKIVIFVVRGDDALVEQITEEYGDDVVIVYGDTDLEFEDLLATISSEGYTIINAQIGEPIEVDDTEYTNENERNIFTLDEGQYFNIKSREPISNIAQIGYGWSSSMMPEYKENAISKIVRLIDAQSNNAMFEYEYSDFIFSGYEDSMDEAGNGQIQCHVIGRVYRKGDYTEVINDDILIPVTVMEEDEDTEDYTPFYGSTVTLKLNNNHLTIEDTGYTGKAVNESNIELEGESYYYEVEWKNRNTDGEDNDITTYVDLTVQDSVLSSRYSEKYGNMIVSPFPVSDKPMIFSRNGEEGVIYYYNDDKEEFSYLIEPYYQYHNGVDLRTADGISIFNLNYGYKTVYLENGLVSLGINRLNGQMYLRKWDQDSKEYITLFYFQLSNYDDVNINSISDDRIELQASDTLISMYRGHPYVIIKQGLEDILILSKFGRVWSEQVGDVIEDYPKYFDLLNTSNLLPECVGGTNINDDCLQVYECGDTVNCVTDKDLCTIYDLETDDVFICPDLSDVAITLDLEDTITEGVETELNVDSEDLVDGDLIYYLVDGDVVDEPVEYPNPLPYTFDEAKEYEVSAVFVGDDTRSYAVSNTVTIFAEPVKSQEQGGGGASEEEGCSPTTGAYKLSIVSCPSKFKYRDKQKVVFRLTRGGVPVCNKTVEMVDFKYMNTATTDRNGMVSFINHHLNSTVGNYKLGARFYEGTKLLTKVFKDVKVVKADVDWTVNHYAGTTGNTVSFHLETTSGYPIDNQKVTVYINGKAYTKKTNANGSVAWKISKKGNKKYKCSFSGNKNCNKKTKSFKEKVR